MLRIETSSPTPRSFEISLAGRLCPTSLPEVDGLVTGALGRGDSVVLDLAEVSSVCREALAALAAWKGRSVALRNLPGYVEEWLAADERATRPGGKALAAALLTALAALAGLGSAAAPASAETVRLSRSEAVRLALTQGAATALAGQRVEEATARADQARAALLPHVEAKLAQSNQSIDLETFGFTIPGQRVIPPFNVTDARVSAAMNVIDLAARARWHAARAGVAVGVAERETTENDVAAAVSTLYTSVLQAQASVDALKSNVELFEKLADLAEDQRKAGVGTRLDTTRALVQLSRQEQALAAAEEARDAARLALLHAAGLDQASDVELTDALAVPPAPPDIATALADARRSRPELRLADERVSAAGLAVEAADAERLPVLGVQLQGGYSGNDLGDLRWTRGIYAGVTVPVFTGGLLKARRSEAGIRRRELETRRTEAGRQVEEEVRRALLSVATARSRVELAEDNLKLAAEELDVARDRFSNGVASSIEVDNAQTSFAAATEDRVAAIARAAQAAIDLARATGRIGELVPGRED